MVNRPGKPNGVTAHMTALTRKLNVGNRPQVAVIAQARGYGRRAIG